MEYKMLAVDVDGTLLNNEDVITEKTKNAIRLAEDKGTVFVISSGRPVQAVLPIIRELGLKKDHPFISYNGAMAVKGRAGEILYQETLSPEDSLKIYRYGLEFDTNIMVWMRNNLYSNKLNEKAFKYGKSAGLEPQLIIDPESFFRTGTTKLLWYDEPGLLKKYADELSDKLGKGVSYYTSRPFYLEFVSSHISKAVALERLGEYCGIRRDEIIAVGDGWNDLTMIKYAGLGVAMGNADSDVKASAAYVTLSNEEDGVAHVIEKFILNK